jgi:N-acetylglucosaminyldiphosphoundecaprenol N-acetyl-beta-D-mannosaminyltransferase
MASQLPSAVPVLACAGVPIAALEMNEAVTWCVDTAQSLSGDSAGLDVHLCNTYTLALADDDHEFRALLNRAALNLADGTPVVWANRLLHKDANPPRSRVRGPSLFVNVLAAGQAAQIKHYLLGSTPETLEAMQREIAQRFPEALIVGTDSPPFRELTEAERLDQRDRIKSSGAQIVWVGLGTPKQDVEAAALANSLPVVAIAVGAAFDFVAGTVEEAPDWMQRSGTEWIHRFAQEPGRLWQRYLVGGPRFVKAVITRRGR